MKFHAHREIVGFARPLKDVCRQRMAPSVQGGGGSRRLDIRESFVIGNWFRGSL
jgi:hypothetical protein